MKEPMATVEHGIRTVGLIDVTVTELVWRGGGRSFEVYTLGGIDLTENGCFDTMPTDAQIVALLGPLWTCGCGRQIAESDADMIVDHVALCDRS
jgi:hypothetical protein